MYVQRGGEMWMNFQRNYKTQYMRERDFVIAHHWWKHMVCELNELTYSTLLFRILYIASYRRRYTIIWSKHFSDIRCCIFIDAPHHIGQRTGTHICLIFLLVLFIHECNALSRRTVKKWRQEGREREREKKQRPIGDRQCFKFGMLWTNIWMKRRMNVCARNAHMTLTTCQLLYWWPKRGCSLWIESIVFRKWICIAMNVEHFRDLNVLNEFALTQNQLSRWSYGFLFLFNVYQLSKLLIKRVDVGLCLHLVSNKKRAV